jgi:hypothetical protein
MCALKRVSVKETKKEKSSVAVKTKEDKELEIELRAKEKVNKLLEDMPIEGDTVVKKDKLQDSKEKKSVEWLEEQISLLADQNSKLESENIRLKDDYRKLFDQYQSSPSSNIDQMKHGIEEIFFELDSTLRGLKYGTPYEQANIRPLLNKFMAKFPFLQNSLKARMMKK